MSKDPHIANIFSAEDEDCLSLEQLAAYQEGRLTGKELYLAERHLVNCELCAIAIESMSEFGAESIAEGSEAVVERAWSRVQARETRKRRGAIYWIAAAASVALLITVGYFGFRGPSDAEIEETLTTAMRDTPPLPPDTGARGSIAMVDERTDNTVREDESLSNGERMIQAEPRGMSDSRQDADGLAAAKNSLQEDGLVTESTNQLSNEGPGSGSTGLLAGSKDNPAKPSSQPTEVAPTGGVATTLFKAPIPDSKAPMMTRDNSNFPAMGDQKVGTKGVAEKTESKKTLDIHAEDDFSMDAVADRSVEEDEEYQIQAKESPSKADPAVLASRRLEDKQSSGRSKAKAAPMRESAKELEQQVYTTAPAAPPSNDFSDGIAAYQSGDYLQAAGKLRKAAELTPDNLQAHLYAADAYLRIAQPQAALFHIERILATPGNSAYEDAEWYKALALLQLKEGRKAEKQLGVVINRNGKYKARAEAALKELK